MLFLAKSRTCRRVFVDIRHHQPEATGSVPHTESSNSMPSQDLEDSHDAEGAAIGIKRIQEWPAAVEQRQRAR